MSCTNRTSWLTALVLCLLSQFAHSAEEYWEYSFRPGDTIWSVAKEYTNSVGNWLRLQKLNAERTGPDKRIPPGTRIIIPVSMLKQQPVPASVISVQGEVSVERTDGTQETVKPGMKLYSGDKIVTSQQQLLRLRFADKSEMQVLPESVVVLDKLSYHDSNGMVDTRIRLERGKVNSWVEKLKPDSVYRVKTPSAVTAVRGTEFRMASSGDTSRTMVTEGVVGVSSGEQVVEVEQGFGLVAVKDEPLPEPVKLLAAPVISDNQVEDRSSLKITWRSIPSAVGFRYRLSTDETFDNIIEAGVTDGASGLSFETIAAGNYWLSLRAVDDQQLDGLVATRNYQIVEPPPPPPPVESADEWWKIIFSVGIILLFF